MAGSEPQTILSGMNPLAVNPANPITLFIFQLAIIVCLCRIIHCGLKYIGQPRVISEIIAGILLGPTVLGRIDSFNKTAFPKESLTYLNLVSNLGLVLFLFIIGLELDPRSLKKNLKKSLAISLVGIIVPFCIGIVVSFLFYAIFQKTGTKYVFMLFIGVALSITAFPVLARVLSELRMIKTTVGQTTITAASIDDVVAWCMLALVVALSKNASGLTAMYILLTGIGYVLFIFFALKPLYLRFLVKKGFLAGRDPSPQIVFITFMLVFISAWFTDALGIHAIFGAYVIGVIVPHEGGFAIKLTEKIEDIVSIFFLPIYFALSGLKTNLAVLNSYKAWLLLILAVCVDMLGKVIGCGGAARFCKFTWRESLTIGVLMSCKGLVELIVLNVGLEAGVINTSVFSVLVLSALITTFITTPITRKLYPAKYHKYPDDDSKDPNLHMDTKSKSAIQKSLKDEAKYSTVISVTRITQLPSLLALLIELTARGSSVMRYAESQDLQKYDSILTTLGAYFQISDISSSLHLSVCNSDIFAEKILLHAENSEVNLAVVSAFEKINTLNDIDNEDVAALSGADFGNTYETHQEFDMITKFFLQAKINVAVFISRGLSSVNFSRETLDFSYLNAINSLSEHGKILSDFETIQSNNKKLLMDEKALFLEGIDVDLPIIYVPFFGGTDDMYSLELVLNLVGNTNVNIQVMYYIKSKSRGDISRKYTNDATKLLALERKSLTPNTKIGPNIIGKKHLQSNKFISQFDRKNTLTSENFNLSYSDPMLHKTTFQSLATVLGISLESLSGLTKNVDDNTGIQNLDLPYNLEDSNISKNKKSEDNDDSKNNWNLFKDKSLKNLKQMHKKNPSKVENHPADSNVKKSKSTKKNNKKSHGNNNQKNGDKNIDDELKKSNDSPHPSEETIELANSQEKIFDFIEDFEHSDKTYDIIKCTKYKNVFFKIFKTEDLIFKSTLHSLSLRQCDMVICGRNVKHAPLSDLVPINLYNFDLQNTNSNSNVPNTDENNKSEPESAIKVVGKEILGPLAQSLFVSNCRASFLVVQSQKSTNIRGQSILENFSDLNQV
ncbi:hypothetical protein BB561_000668 [Smittium simulii]|uniref:Cation/H+ exchanger transmembrane domain-containing protein n=1 Tax=Smittium simulii TaxID=133385 RepID=A0A2T9YY64_9FUNG|nr:hypothetical protein BB561_000668 [Smittium simulii]